jgi:hypothetical protein
MIANFHRLFSLRFVTTRLVVVKQLGPGANASNKIFQAPVLGQRTGRNRATQEGALFNFITNGHTHKLPTRRATEILVKNDLQR